MANESLGVQAPGFFPVGRDAHAHFSRLEQRIKLAVLSSGVDPSVVFVFRSRMLLGLLVQQLQKMRAVAACEGEQEALSVLESQSAGLLILGDDLSNGSPHQIVRRAKALHPDLRVMHILQHPELYQGPGFCHALIADADLGRDDDYTFYQGLMAMLTNTTYLSPLMLSLQAQRPIYLDSPSIPFVSLTTRERDILRCYAQGLTNKESAEALNLSSETVKTYSGRLLSKLGVNNRQKALRRAAALGLDRLLLQD
jgi:DNA-binding NarL/FixJ family response regulator